MKIIGVVGRVYYNRDEQEIIQINDAVRRALVKYSDVVSILLLPTNDSNYGSFKMGDDKLEEIDKKKLDYILDKCDAFIVPGGTYWYQFDEYVMKHAIKNNKPLLGICAGFQAICSMFAKDRFKFDMTNKLNNDIHYGKYNKYIHNVNLVDGTVLMDILKCDKVMVNSLHHDYVDFDINSLIVSAYSDDGVIEAVELPGHVFFMGIQWHPEYLMDDYSKKIFDRFIDSVKELHK